jgi:very-short-patch-repair endonuclease
MRFMPASSPQQNKLLHYVRMKYPEAVNNYKIRITWKRYCRWADIGLPSLRVDIEYDGKAYHRNKLKDYKRDQELKRLGWRTIRVNARNWNTFMVRMKEIIEDGEALG